MTVRGDHYSVELCLNEEGWWHGRCHCGLDLGMFPDAEDACDALMDHAYEVGAADVTKLLHDASNPATSSEPPDSQRSRLDVGLSNQDAGTHEGGSEVPFPASEPKP